jgi:hypothetical protein
MNYIVANPKSERDLIDFFITVGDNLYPINSRDPQDFEFDWMMTLFTRPQIDNLDIYPVRGNHDCMFAWDREIKLQE